MPMLIVLSTVDDVIDALGGTYETARLLDLKYPQPVSQWRKRARLPADKFLIMQSELEKRGKTAPPELWGIKPTAEAAA